MSIGNAKAYIERVRMDEDFRDQMATHKDETTRKNYAAWAGFEFTEAEIIQVNEESWSRYMELRADWIDAWMLLKKGRMSHRMKETSNKGDDWINMIIE